MSDQKAISLNELLHEIAKIREEFTSQMDKQLKHLYEERELISKFNQGLSELKEHTEELKKLL